MMTYVLIGLGVAAVVGVLIAFGIVAVTAFVIFSGKRSSIIPTTSTAASPSDTRRDEIQAVVGRDFQEKWAAKQSAAALSEFSSVMNGTV